MVESVVRIPRRRRLRGERYVVGQQGDGKCCRAHAVIIVLIRPELAAADPRANQGVCEIHVSNISSDSIWHTFHGGVSRGGVAVDGSLTHSVNNRRGGAHTIARQLRDGICPRVGIGICPGDARLGFHIYAVSGHGQSERRRARAVEVGAVRPSLAAGERNRGQGIEEICGSYVAVFVHLAIGRGFISGAVSTGDVAIDGRFFHGVHDRRISALLVTWQAGSAVTPSVLVRRPDNNGLWHHGNAIRKHGQCERFGAGGVAVGDIQPALFAGKGNGCERVGEVRLGYVAGGGVYRARGGRSAREGVIADRGFFHAVHDLRRCTLLVTRQIRKAVRPHAGTVGLHPRYAGLRSNGNPIRQYGKRDAGRPHTVTVAVVHPSFAARDIYGD